MIGSASLPKFFRVKQNFSNHSLANIGDCVRQSLTERVTCSLAGRSVAVAVGSRGIASLPTIVCAVVDWLREQQAEPFVVPAMGSHGGATANGQISVLNSLGIHEEAIQCSIRSSMDADLLGDTQSGIPVYWDRIARSADFVLLVNRIKPHTRFSGKYQSGLNKMLLIGLGNHIGAEVYHRAALEIEFDQIVREASEVILSQSNVLGGIAIEENANEEVAAIEVLLANEFLIREPEILKRVEQAIPKLPFVHANLLIVDEIGKNISGTGMDTNVIGRKKNDRAAIDGEMPDIHHIYVRSLTAQTAGNATGIGMADMCHQRVLTQMDREKTRKNCITANHISGAMTPVDFSSDREAIETACRSSGLKSADATEVMWIRNTLHLSEIECSEVYWSRAVEDQQLTIVCEPRPLAFDADDNLKDHFR